MLLEIDRKSPSIEASSEHRTLRPRTMIDLFAGCGGLSLGFEHAGFMPVFVNELNDDARATYLANRDYLVGDAPFNQRTELHSADVSELNNQRLADLKAHLETLDLGLTFGEAGTLDVLAGGPPCQGYSGIGHRRKYSVDKAELPSNRLYEKMAFVIEQVRPRIFLFENVKGLLSARWTSEGSKGEIWQDVFGRFKRLGEEHGYQVRWKLVHAKNYGVPQNRPRVLIVGLRNDLVAKIGDQVSLSTHAEDAVACGFLPHHGELAPDLEEIFADLEDGQVTGMLQKQDFDQKFSTHFYPRAASGYWQNYFRPGVMARSMAPLLEQDYSKHSAHVVAKFSAMLKNGCSEPRWSGRQRGASTSVSTFNTPSSTST